MTSLCTLDVLDVGHGNAAVLQAGDSVTVIDAGLGVTLIKFLEAEGINRIDRVLLSHSDRDHVAGTINLLASETFDVRAVYVNPDSKPSSIWASLAWELKQWHDRTGGLIELQLRQGMVFGEGPVRINVLAPGIQLSALAAGAKDKAGRTITANSRSAVIRIDAADKPVALLPADLDDVGLEHLTEDGQSDKLNAQVLVYPHHGGASGRGRGEGSSPYIRSIIDLVSPSTVIFSNGRGSYDLPRAEVVAQIREIAPSARLGCTQLSRGCATEAPALEDETAGQHLLPLVAHGSSARKCCGGTWRIVCDDTRISVLPDEAAHKGYIAACAPTALCQRQN
ncbi:MBL fold metallo-hydrolase [Lentzea sp. NEAU-D13]|uniref:MBL fold metallo-hydrolase n=1 Tax=Lentzea alba TaxID=2714351 RepID=A0A7C9RT78_9PSEU|nr:MBL fold metallo-hydrolase [Lentzea alba]NGY61626.1 MBL fold metallo-hydrolase [Lentzea alba]